MSVPFLVLVAAAALVVAALGWRRAQTRQLTRRCTELLNQADPGARVAGVAMAGELGLSATAPALLKLARTETDSDVLAAVCETVAHHQWEPASSRRLVELRLWAKAYREANPEEERRLVAASRRGRRLSSGDLSGDPVDPDPLPPTRVLVTGAGGAAGVAVIRALRRAGHQVVAVDADPDAAGLALAHDALVVPVADDPGYLPALLEAATGADALICTVAEEYRAIRAGAPLLDRAGVRTLLPDADAAECCLDKWRFFEVMQQAGLPTPATRLGEAGELSRPWLVKPRRGRGSRQVSVAHNRTALKLALATTEEPLVQALLRGREFTVDTLTDRSGAVVAAVPRWRLETRGGISTKGETFEHPEVTNLAALTVKATGLVGPANVQGFVTDADEVYVHEVNPRFSGGLPLSLAAGADLVGEYLRAVMGRPVRPERLAARPGIRMSRHFAETYSEPVAGPAE